MAPARNPIFKDVPTLKEAMGIDYATGAWRGIGAPKGLPPDVATKLTAALKKVYDSAGVQGLHEQSRLRHGVGRCRPSSRASWTRATPRWAKR